jgi:protein-S-isoprenylcysteine O-methyltransferase Ste14
MAESDKTAGVVAYPPLIYGVPLLASILADGWVSRRRLPPVAALASIGFIFAAGRLVAPSFAAFKKAGTAVDPFEESTALVETGPFAYTRNPIYLGLTLAYIGVALAARRTAPLALLPGILWVMNEGVISREERYLERKFGNVYRDYMRRVPRWL